MIDEERTSNLVMSTGKELQVIEQLKIEEQTDGSVLVIGSAAGVVAMGMEKIEFFWYLKKIGWLAFIGFISGFITFVLLEAYVLV